jgi:hypothetical protein
VGHLEPRGPAGAAVRDAGRKAAAALGAALALAGAAQAATPTACNVRLNVIDPDPAGLNVRSAPGGAIVTALKARGRWVRVHVAAQEGDWARIDHARLISEETGAETPLFDGTGYVSISKLGIEELNLGARIVSEPAADAGLLFKVDAQDESELPKALVLGCWGDFLKVRVNGKVGWTRDFCTNRLTTCV